MSKSNFIVRGGGDFSGLYKEFNVAQKRMSTFQKGMSTALKSVAGLFGGLAMGSLAKDFAQTAMRTETLEVAMRSVARASGYATEELNKAKDAIRDKGIAEQESMQILTRFMQSQLDVADAADLARVAQDAAVIANLDSSQAAEQMTEAIAKQRPELLSAFGMTKNLNVILSEYANTLGKSANELGEAERKQAMLNYILQEGQKIAGTYEASMDAVGKKIGSLPRHYQDLQNAIATPVMMPAIGVAVDAITNAFQRATAWAQANTMSLQYWGQMVAHAVGNVVNTFHWLTQTLANNWQWIRYLIGGYLYYRTVVFAVAQGKEFMRIATERLAVAQAVLRGELASGAGVLGFVSRAIGIYRLQMALAPAATNIFSGALLRLRTALYAVHAALGPIGWAIIAISGVVAGGVALWGRYSNSVNKVNQAKMNTVPATKSANNAIQSQRNALGPANKALDNMGKNADKAGKGQKKLGKDIKKAAKEAKGSLAGFDEINTLQQDMGDADMGGLDDIGDIGDIGGAGGGIPDIGVPDMGGLGDLGGLDGGLGDLGLGDLMDDMEMAKPTLKGFWEWIKKGAGNIWEWVKEKWLQFDAWVKSWPIWEWIREKLRALRDWAMGLWDKVKDKWSQFVEWVKGWAMWDRLRQGWQDFKDWASSFWDSVKVKWDNFKSWVSTIFGLVWRDIKQSWNDFTTWASNMWQGAKAKWGQFTTWVSDGFSKLWAKTKETWNTFTTWASNMWESTKRKWNDFKESTKKTFGDMWTSIKSTFSNTKKWFGDTFGGAWDRVKSIFSISNIRTHFNNTVSTIKGVFRSIPDWFRTTFTTAWTNVKNVFSSGGRIFTGIKDGIASTFRTIVNGLINGINRIIRVPFNAINRTLNRVRGISIMGAKPFSGFISHNAINVPQIPRLAKGGITNGEMLAVVGDNPGGREVVSPLNTLQDMLVEAVGTAMTNNNSGNDRPINIEVVSKIGDTEFGRKSIKAINEYQDRMGQTLLIV